MHPELTILVVEDEPRTRNGIRKTLELWYKSRASVVSVENGIEALQYMEANPVHLIITDIRMPGMSGLNMLESVRARYPEIPAVIISGYAEFGYAREALELQVSSYLLKPIDKEKLIKAADQALKRGQQHNRYRQLERVADPGLVRIDRERPAIAAAIQEVLRYIEEHYDQPISLKDAAEYVHMNPSYISVLFKEQTGMTFSEYLAKFRMQKSKEYLITTRMNINEISEKVGYLTAKYFIKVFREHEQISPSEYRKAWNRDM